MFEQLLQAIVQAILTSYKKMLLVLISIILLFTLIGVMTTVKPSSRLASSLFTTWTANMDDSIFTQLYRLEDRQFDLMQQTTSLTEQINHLLFQLMTSVKLNDLNSLIQHEIPGLSTYKRTVIVRSGDLDEVQFLSHESGPPLETIMKDRKAVTDKDKQEEPYISTNDKKVVLLYNSHNRESFLPHLVDEKDPGKAYHDEVNITKVSERIAKSLEKRGIGTYVDETDIMGVLNEKGWTFGQSYQASREVVQAAIAENEDITYMMDIHRDSLPRSKTTKEFQGKNYASILFVIGAEHKDYEKNLKLATKMHEKINGKYKGVSKGVITKEGPGNNGIYNQDLLEQAILIEVGGYENTLDEMYLSADVIAEMFTEIYMEAEKVNQ